MTTGPLMYLPLPRPQRTRRASAVISVVVDQQDDIDVQRTIEGMADHTVGCAVITLTPCTDSAAVLYHDVILGIGQSTHPQWMRVSRRMVKLAVDGLRRREVSDLIILRAHTLSAASCGRLARLAKLTPLRLWLVVHGRRSFAHIVRAVRRSGVRFRVAMPGSSALNCLPGARDLHCHFS